MRTIVPVALAVAALVGGCVEPRTASSSLAATDAEGCTRCHGDASRPATVLNPALPAAPPATTTGRPDAVGAHQVHLLGGAIGPAVVCASCHVVPGDSSHAGGGAPVVVFGSGTLATAQGATPTYQANALTCSSTYCHGSFRFGPVTGSAGPTPAWNAGGPLACTGCHGMPPAGHPALAGTVSAATCAACHPATVKPDGTIDVAAGKHLDGQAEFQGGHTDPSWADPTHHGYQASMGGLPACTGCHVGFGTAGGATGSSCNECHSGGTTAWQTNCTFCHGTAGRTGAMSGADARLAAAPPVGTQGETATATVAVGAHQAHVNPAASGAVKGPLACTSCHPSPLPADVTHVNGQPTPIQFGGLAVQGGATPSYVRGESPTCSSTYCHGSFRFGGVTGNVVPPPAWNAAGRLGCTGCHGMPPAGHPALTGTVNAATCSSCHPATVGPDGTIDVAAGKHLNGQAEIQGGHTDPAWADPTHHGYQASATGVQTCTGCHVGFGAVAGIAGSSCNDCHSGGTSAWQSNCTFCHGTAGRTGIVTGTDARLAAAPPVGSQGQTTRSQAAVGAHQAHVNPPATTWMAGPVACTVCHPSPLPADVAHVDGQPAPVEFSGLATNWGLTPTYARGANPTCASTYCHGGGLVGGTNTTPSWTGGSMTCTSCHGIPPGTGEHGNHPGGNDCNLCHPGVNAAGTALTSRTRHADGIVDVTHGDGTWSCDTCH